MSLIDFEATIGLEFSQLFGEKEEIYRLIDISTGVDPEKNRKKQIIYTFETFFNGVRTERPTFSMGKKWFEDLITRHIWTLKTDSDTAK